MAKITIQWQKLTLSRCIFAVLKTMPKMNKY